MFPIRDTIPAKNFPIVTWIIIVANTLAFVLQLSLNEAHLNEFLYLYGLVPARFSHPAWAEAMGFPNAGLLPFISNAFLHGGWAHYIGNMWTLYIFGDNVEDKMGSLRFLVFYLLTGVVASFTHYLININSVVPAIGASGAISGVMGAYLMMFPKSKIIFFLPVFFLPYFIELSAFVYLTFWFISQLFSGTLGSITSGESGGIAFWAHIGGFGAGMLLYKLFLRKERKRFYNNYWNEQVDYRRYF
jgi:membrane associated rhomboid family serine protease